MLAAALVTFREGFEAALVVVIVLAALNRVGLRSSARAVWWGAAAGIAVSLAAGLVLYALGTEFSGRPEQAYEGTAMVAAAAFLTWMIFWTQSQGRRIAERLEAEAHEAAAGERRGGLFALAFVAVGREGLETALFLTALAFAETGRAALLGGLGGLLAAALAGWALFRASHRLSVSRFFQVTGLLLIVVAAGLLAHGVHEYQEASILPTYVENVWDTNSVLDEDSAVGALLKSLFGYDGNPSLVQVTSYWLYWAVVGGALLVMRRKQDSELRTRRSLCG